MAARESAEASCQTTDRSTRVSHCNSRHNSSHHSNHGRSTASLIARILIALCLLWLLDSLLSVPSISESLLAKFDALQKSVDEAVLRKRLLRPQRREVLISGIHSCDAWLGLQASGFQIEPDHWTDKLTDKLTADAHAADADAAADAPFQWAEANEKQQAAAYTEYVCARLSPLPDNVRLVSASTDLLHPHSPLLPFNVRGTTDLILVEQTCPSAQLPVEESARGIRALFELKKEMNAAHSQQAIVKLIVADISSAFRPFVLLSDLKESFFFFWLDAAKERNALHPYQIHHLAAPSRKPAFLLLNRLLAQCSRVEDEIRAAEAYLDTLGVGIHKRRKLAEQRDPRGVRG
jgi:hypothetical protein